MDVGVLSQSSSTGSSTLSHGSPQTQEFESSLLPLIHSFAYRYPAIISILSLVIELLQYLAFALNPRVMGNRLVWGIIYLFQLPFWDGVFTKGAVTYPTFITVYWVFTGVHFALILLFAIGLQWTHRTTQFIRASGVTHILSLMLSILYIPSIQMYMSALTCQHATSLRAYSDAPVGYVFLFVAQGCDTAQARVHMGLSIAFLILWGAMTYLFTMTLVPVDREDPSVRRRCNTAVDFWLFIYRTGLCISGMLLTAYDRPTAQAIIVGILSLGMASLHCFYLPYYRSWMNSLQAVAFAVIGWAAFTTFIADFGTRSSPTERTVMAHQGAMYAVLCCGAVVIGALFYFLSRIRYDRHTNHLMKHVLTKNFVPLTANPFAVAALQRNLDLLPFPHSLPKTDVQFSSLHGVAVSILEEGLQEEEAIRQAREADEHAARGTTTTTASGTAADGRGDADGAVRGVPGNGMHAGKGRAARDAAAAGAGADDSNFHNSHPLSAHSLLREAGRRQVVSPTIGRALVPSDAEVAVRFLSEWQTLTETFPTPHMVCFASRVFHRFLLKYPHNSMLIVAYVSFICDYAPSLPRMTLCLELIRRACAELSLSLTERYLLYFFSLHVKESLGIRDAMHQSVARKARQLHHQTLLRSALVWRCLLEEQRSPMAMYTFTNALAKAREKCYAAYMDSIGEIADDAELLKSMGQFMSEVYHFRNVGRLCDNASEVVGRLQQLRLERAFHSTAAEVTDDAYHLAAAGDDRGDGDGDGNRNDRRGGGAGGGAEIVKGAGLVTGTDNSCTDGGAGGEGDDGDTESFGSGAGSSFVSASSRLSSSMPSTSNSRLSSLCTSEGRSSQSKVRNSKLMSQLMAERVRASVLSAFAELTSHVRWGVLTVSNITSKLLMVTATVMVTAIVLSQLQQWAQLQRTMEDISFANAFSFMVLTQVLRTARLLPEDVAVGLTTEEHARLVGNITYVRALIDATESAHNAVFYGRSRVEYSGFQQALTSLSQYFRIHSSGFDYVSVRVSFLSHVPMVLSDARRVVDKLAEIPTGKEFLQSVDVSALTSNVMDTLTASYAQAENDIRDATRELGSTSIIVSVVAAALSLLLVSTAVFLLLWNYRRAASIVTRELMHFYLIPRESVEQLATEAQHQLDQFTYLVNVASNRTLGWNKAGVADLDFIEETGGGVVDGGAIGRREPVSSAALKGFYGPELRDNQNDNATHTFDRGSGGVPLLSSAHGVKAKFHRNTLPRQVASIEAGPSTAAAQSSVTPSRGDRRRSSAAIAGGVGGAAASLDSDAIPLDASGRGDRAATNQASLLSQTMSDGWPALATDTTSNGHRRNTHSKPASVRLLSQLLTRARFDYSHQSFCNGGAGSGGNHNINASTGGGCSGNSSLDSAGPANAAAGTAVHGSSAADMGPADIDSSSNGSGATGEGHRAMVVRPRPGSPLFIDGSRIRDAGRLGSANIARRDQIVSVQLHEMLRGPARVGSAGSQRSHQNHIRTSSSNGGGGGPWPVTARRSRSSPPDVNESPKGRVSLPIVMTGARGGRGDRRSGRSSSVTSANNIGRNNTAADWKATTPTLGAQSKSHGGAALANQGIAGGAKQGYGIPQATPSDEEDGTPEVINAPALHDYHQHHQHGRHRRGLRGRDFLSRLRRRADSSGISDDSSGDGEDLRLLNVFDYHSVVSNDVLEGLLADAALNSSTDETEEDGDGVYKHGDSDGYNGNDVSASRCDGSDALTTSGVVNRRARRALRSRARKEERAVGLKRIAEARRRAQNIGFMAANYELSKKILEGGESDSSGPFSHAMPIAASVVAVAAADLAHLRRMAPSVIIAFLLSVVAIALLTATIFAHLSVAEEVDNAMNTVMCLSKIVNTTTKTHLHVSRYVASGRYSEYVKAADAFMYSKIAVHACHTVLNSTFFFSPQKVIERIMLVAMALVARNSIEDAGSDDSARQAFPLVADLTWTPLTPTTSTVSLLEPYLTAAELAQWAPYTTSAADYALSREERQTLAIDTILGPFGLAVMEGMSGEFTALSDDIVSVMKTRREARLQHFRTLQIASIVCWSVSALSGLVYLYLVVFPPSSVLSPASVLGKASSPTASADAGRGGAGSVSDGSYNGAGPSASGSGGRNGQVASPTPSPSAGAAAAIDDLAGTYAAAGVVGRSFTGNRYLVAALVLFEVFAITGIALAGWSLNEVSLLSRYYDEWLADVQSLSESQWDWHRTTIYGLSYPFVNCQRSILKLRNATSAYSIQQANTPLLPQPSVLNKRIHSTEFMVMGEAKALYLHYAWLAMVCAVWGRERQSIFAEMPDISYVRWDMESSKEQTLLQFYKRLYPSDTYLSTFEKDVTANAAKPAATLGIAQGFMNSRMLHVLAEDANAAQRLVMNELMKSFTATVAAAKHNAQVSQWSQLALLAAAFVAILVAIVLLAALSIRAFSRTVEEKIIFQTAFRARSMRALYSFGFVFLLLVTVCVLCVVFSVQSVARTNVGLAVLEIRHSLSTLMATATAMATAPSYEVLEARRESLLDVLHAAPARFRTAYYVSRAAVSMRKHRSHYLYGGQENYADYSSLSSSILRPMWCVDPTSPAADGNQQPVRIQLDAYNDIFMTIANLPRVTLLRKSAMNPYLEDAYSRLGTMLYLTYGGGGTALQYMRSERNTYTAVCAVLAALAFVWTVATYTVCLRKAERDVREQSIGSKIILLGIPADILNTLPEITEFYDPETGSSGDQMKKRMQQSERLLQNILPLSISRRLKNGERVIADAHPRVTVVFAALVGMDEYSHKLSGTRLVQFMNGLVVAFDHIVDLLDLEKIKLVGDIYFFCGGLTRKTERDHAVRCMEASLFFFQALEEHNSRHGTPHIKLKIGINTGPVVAGVIGNKKVAYDLWGDCVNTASRMYSTGEPARVQVSHSTYERLSKYYQFEDREVQAKGKGTLPTHLFLDRIKNTPYTDLNWRVSS